MIEYFFVAIEKPILRHYHWLNGALTLNGYVKCTLFEWQQLFALMTGAFRKE